MSLKPIGTLGNVDITQIGGRYMVDSNVVTLGGYSTAGGNGCTLRKTNTPGVSSGYAATGSGFLVKAVRIFSVSAANVGLVMAQSDNDIGFDSGTALTNAAYLAGTASFILCLTNSGTAGLVSEICVNFLIGTGKYLTIKPSGSAVVHIVAFGYDQP